MNNNGNGRPLSKRKTVQVLVIFTILAWATQTLLHQWGFGQMAPTAEAFATDAPATQPIEEGSEKFVPGGPRFSSGTTLDVRSEATVVGGDVKLKQVCRWSDADGSVFAPIADLVIVRLSAAAPYRSITVSDIKTLLHDAGVNVAAINFAGAVTCTVNRSDIQVDEGDALKKWIDAHEGKEPTPGSASASASASRDSGNSPATQPANPPSSESSAPKLASAAVQPDSKTSRSLRDFLLADLSTRLGLPIDKLEVAFRPQDERVLNLGEPLFKFQLEARRVRDLGEVSWNVTIVTEGTNTQRVQIGATARAWQTQLVVAKPISFKQVLRDQDVIVRRTLIDHLLDDTVLDSSQAIGQQAARDLKPGQVLTARLVDAVQLIRAGQFVTVVYRQGNIELKTVARALDSGAFGQTIRVKNEATRDIFEVILTGPQTATMSAGPGLESPASAAAATPKVVSAHE